MAVDGVRTFLWFDDQALPAAQFYADLFPGGCITSVAHYGDGAPKPAGTVMVVEFEIFGRPFAGLNGGPQFPHSQAVSFQVRCDTQEEIDRVWDALIADGGQESQCGWCQDRFGIHWQVVPSALGELLSAGAGAWQAMMGMRRIVIADLASASA